MDYYATVRDAKEEMQKLYHAIKSLESSPPSTISSTGLPYYLSYCPRGFKPVPSIFDAPGNGLVLKHGLV